jgi:hypothetical protein
MRKTTIILLILFSLLLAGCSTGNSDDEKSLGTVKLIISKDYGQEVLYDKELPWRKNMTVMDLLSMSELKLDLSYGGTFINGIDGNISVNDSKSGRRTDWFFFANGIFADVGSLDYFPKGGEVIWWDYHSWDSKGGATTASIGFIPSLIEHGYSGSKKPAYSYVNNEDFLFAENIEIRNISEWESDQKDKEVGPKIIFGQWQTLSEILELREINQDYRKAGLFGIFSENNSLLFMDYKFTPLKEYKENAGYIFAVGQYSGDNSPNIIVTGIDKAGYESAKDIFINYPEKIKGKYSVAIINGEVVPLPLEN